MRWKSHVRFGGRARETHQPKGWQGALVRPTTLGEDLHRARTGSGPHVLATCRNLTISLLRLADHSNIARALRHHARHTDQAVALVVNENPKPA